MTLEFKFKDINALPNKKPTCRIELNGETVFTGEVEQRVKIDAETKSNNVLRIFFENKNDNDTIVDEHNKIVQDLNFALEKVVIDGLDLKNLIWESRYVAGDDTIESCLFFGPKGYWEIKFDSPILKWWLKTNHNKNKNDPTWETDYNFYEKVCQKLNKIQTK